MSGNAKGMIVNEAADHILFILGAPRSGTSHLSTVVAKAFGYGMGPEGQFVLNFMSKISRYGDLSDLKNLNHLVSDISRDMMFTILREQYRVNVTPPVILERIREPTYAGVVEAIFKAIADLRGVPRIGNKYPDYWQNLPGIEALFPGRAKYLCIMRDGRDVFLSLQGVPWGRHSPYVAAKLWVDIDQKIRNFAERVGEGRFLLVQYEQLSSAMDRTLAKIEDFLGISIPSDVRASLLADNDKRINYGKWKTSMSRNDQEVYEAIAGNVLRRYGYETLFADPSIGSGAVLGYKVRELARLVRINFYHTLNRRRPGDRRNDPQKAPLR